MIKIEVLTKPVTDHKTTCYSFLVTDDIPSSVFKECEKKLGINISQYLKKQDFTAKVGETFSLPVIKNNELFYVVVVGLGKKDAKSKISMESLRRALGATYKKVASLKEETFALAIPAASEFGVTAQELGQQVSTILNMTSYRFQEFFSEKDKKETEIEVIYLSVASKDSEGIEQGIKDGEYIAKAVNKARHWVDLPPSHLTPPELAEKAKAIAKNTGLKITVFGEDEIIKQGMGGLAAVGRGSDHESRFVILEYEAPKKNAPTIAFVGKGITFDSGGLSIKPALNMETMKEDMSGAAAVITTMEAIAHLKPNVNVIGITPLAENLPSHTATKPGDIVRFYNGKTAEVKNTDAEGRLILADALSYAAKHYKPDAIIDIATLTGACAYALGPFFSGLMSCHDELVEKVIQSAQRSGDYVWRLPLTDDYAPAIKSDVADLSNIGSQKYMAGAITAAYFLKNFVNNIPWVHLDIAGTAFNVPDISYYRTGATGTGVRLLIDIAMNWK
jgi:leucyl aminopeptidase